MFRRRRVLPTMEDLVHGLAVAIVFLALSALGALLARVLILLVTMR
jgi:hypothetical protein